MPSFVSPSKLKAKRRWQHIRKARRARSFRKKMDAAAVLEAKRAELAEYGTLDFDWVGAYNPRWAKTRAFILKRDRGRCVCCDTELRFRLHCHHIVPRRYPDGTEQYTNLVALCPKCHRAVDIAIWSKIELGSEDMGRKEIVRLCQNALLHLAKQKASPQLPRLLSLLGRA